MSARAEAAGHRRTTELAELLAAARGGAEGNRRALARLLSLVERGGDQARRLSQATAQVLGSVYSIGLTGAPGAGKSTLTARLVAEMLKRGGGPIAVLAVDPSSPLSGGAILGDRVRMQDHALDRNVFIRSMATRGHLGGLAAAVPDAVRLLEAAGWPTVLVETVGVGQIEVDVAGTCDSVVVVLNPGWGDAVQANKAGLLEVADVLVINKADRPGVRETRRDLVHMLQLSGSMAWTPPILETVATSGDGIAELSEAIARHREFLEESGGLERRRAKRMVEEARRIAVSRFAHEVGRRLASDDVVQRFESGALDPATAADEVVTDICHRLSSEA